MRSLKHFDPIRIGTFLVLVALLAFAPVPEAAAQVTLPSLAEEFSWREVGPANPGGRITDVEGVESAPHIIYIGTATGGLWKTVNAGITLEPMFDDQPIASIGDIGLSRSHPNVLYVGTGEPNNRNSSPWGAGVFKSTDGGETWTYVGLKETRHIARVIVHPTNPDMVYVAAMGHLWGFNEDRGVFKTTDGGATLGQGPLPGRADRRHRPGHGPGGPGHPLCRRPHAGEGQVRRRRPHRSMGTQGRHLRHPRRRCELGEGRGGPAHRGDGPDRNRCVPEQPGHGLRPGERRGPGLRRRKGRRPAGGTSHPWIRNRDGIFKSTDYGVTWEKVNDWNNRPVLLQPDPGRSQRRRRDLGIRLSHGLLR